MTALMWDRWLAEEQARAATRQPSQARRRSLTVPDDVMATVDRVAAVQGLTRHQLVEYVLRLHFASWRPYPKEGL